MTAEHGKVLILNKPNLIRLGPATGSQRSGCKNLPPRMNYRNQINVRDCHYNRSVAL